ncbi:MAG: hypothetical protein U0031_02025 [Thermomicrobiales bacterium]
MDSSTFDALVRSFVAGGGRSSRRGAVGALALILTGVEIGSVYAGKSARKKQCRGGKTRCGKRCCPKGQGCVGGRCGCPAMACANAVDPTDDQLEGCFCDVTVGGKELCLSSIPCGLVTACSANSDCPRGWVCLKDACQEGVGGCAAVCSLG